MNSNYSDPPRTSSHSTPLNTSNVVFVIQISENSKNYIHYILFLSDSIAITQYKGHRSKIPLTQVD